MLTYKRGPSVARMVKFLGLSKAQATELKRMMNEGYVFATLNLADKYLDGCGREYLYSSDGSNGVDYVNMGDTYNTTLMFDFAKDKFIVGSWGDLVEAQPRRFAD
jgi:hypothetical protein